MQVADALRAEIARRDGLDSAAEAAVDEGVAEGVADGAEAGVAGAGYDSSMSIGALLWDRPLERGTLAGTMYRNYGQAGGEGEEATPPPPPPPPPEIPLRDLREGWQRMKLIH